MLRYIIGISLIAIVIMIVRAISDGKIQRRQQYALWLFIPVYMIISPFLSINIPVNEGIYSVLPLQDNAAIYSEHDALKPIVPDENSQVITASSITETDNVQTITKENVPNAVNHIVEEHSKPVNKINWKSVINITYCIVTASLFFALIIYNAGFVMFCRRNRKFKFRDPNSGLHVYSIRHSGTPFLLANKIYVDDGLNKISKYVVCHEASHYKHLDFIWIVVRYLVLALNWYNPVIWVAFIMSGIDCELACDEEVLCAFGKESSKEYAETLFELIKQRSISSFSFSISTEMRGEFKNMKKRLASIKKPVNKGYKALALSLAAVMIFSSCALIKPQPINTDNYWYGCSSFRIPSAKGYHQNYCDSIYADGYYYVILSGIKEDKKIEGPDEFYKLYKIDPDGNGVDTVSLPAQCISPQRQLIIHDKLHCIEPYSNTEYVIDVNSGEILSEKPAEFGVYNFCPIDEGYVVQTMDSLIRYTDDGIETGRIKTGRYYESFFQRDGKFYLIENLGNKLSLSEVNFDNKTVGKANEINTQSLSLSDIEIKKDLIFTDRGVYYLDAKTRSFVPLTEWNYVDIKPGYKTALYEMNTSFGNERFGKLYEYVDNEFELIIFNKISADIYANRQRITIGGYGVNSSMAIKWAVYNFNTSQKEYRVFLDDYWNEYGYTAMEDAQVQTAKLIKHFNEGNAPDIYFGTNFDYRYMYNAGLVTDMLPLIEKDPDFSLDDLVPSVRDTITKNGVCYQIFSSYSFNGDFGLKSDFEGKDITYANVDALAQIKGISLQGDSTAYDIADKTIRYSLGELMDRASGDHILSLDELRDIVDYSIRNGVSSGTQISLFADMDTVHNGTCLTCRRTWLGNLYELNEIESSLNDSFIYLGFPSVYGSAHSADPDGLVAISSDSKYKDICWQFIKFMLSDEVQEIAIGQKNNPVINRIFEDHCRFAAHPESVPETEIVWKCIVDGKKPVPEWVISDYRAMAYSIDSVISYDWGLFTIIRDEINSYYLQNKKPDEIAKTLQSRIDLYVSENYK